jgi:Polyketide cyclase / dehydrase and lipid transport
MAGSGASARVSATRRISASADEIFAVVSDPAGHVAIDGSGMLKVSRAIERLSEPGQVFEMEMDRRLLSDIQDLTDYRIRNTVTKLVPNRLAEWSVAIPDQPPAGHVWGWKIDPVGDQECDVSHLANGELSEMARNAGGQSSSSRRKRTLTRAKYSDVRRGSSCSVPR